MGCRSGVRSSNTAVVSFCFEAANWLRVAFIIMAIFILCKERLDCTLAALKQLEYFEGSCLECF